MPKYLIIVFSYTLFLYAFLGIFFSEHIGNNYNIFLVNILFFIIYFGILMHVSNHGIKLRDLLIIIFIFNVIFVAAFNFLFYLHSESFFAFNAADSLNYDRVGKAIAEGAILESLNKIPERYSFDDYGFFLYVGFLYRIIINPLFVNFINIILQCFSVFFIYKIGSRFLSRKYNGIAALIFGISSYSCFFLSSGLKEPLMLFLLLFSYYLYFIFVQKKRYVFLFSSLLVCLLLIFFRVPVVLIMFLSIILPKYGKRRLTKGNIIILLSAIAISFAILNYRFDLLSRYLNIIGHINQANFNHDGIFVYANGILAGFLGPLPTFLPIGGHSSISMYAPSLSLKCFLSIYFIIGIYLVLKRKIAQEIKPIVFYSLFEIIAVISVADPFELRKSYLHIPFVIMISMFAFQHLYQNKYKFIFLKKCAFAYTHLFAGVLFFWNYLRL